MPENRRRFRRMCGEDILRMGACPAQARSRCAERLDFVYGLFPRLRERRRQFAGTMSGGEQQMCAIGRALLSGPKLLLMDAPAAGLAPVIVEPVFELVRRHRQEGYPVLNAVQTAQPAPTVGG